MNVIRAIERISAEDGMGMSQKRVTVSTAGIAKMIKKWAMISALQTRLSLHEQMIKSVTK